MRQAVCPSFIVNGVVIPESDNVKYLGHIICSDLSDDEYIGVAEWARALTGDRTVNGSSLAAVKTFRFASELWQFRLPRLASVFRMRH